MVDGDDLAIQHGVRKGASLKGDFRKLVGPVQPLARVERYLSVLHAQLDPIAVEFHFVAPGGSTRRLVDRHTKLRSDEIGHS